MRNNKRLIVGAILLGVAVFGGGAWWAYVRQRATFDYVITRQDIAAVPLLNPQTAIPARLGAPEWGLAYSGIIETVDAKNKFVDVRIPPLFPASLATFGYNDVMRFHFDDDVSVRLVTMRTEDGVAVGIKIGKWLDTSELKSGRAVRISGQYDFEDGLFFAKTVFVYEYLPRLPLSALPQ